MQRKGWILCLAPIGLLLLSGCATARPDPAAPAVIVKCLSVTPVSKAQQLAAANEVDRLPADSVLANVIVPDWATMRAKARACADVRG